MMTLFAMSSEVETSLTIRSQARKRHSPKRRFLESVSPARTGQPGSDTPVRLGYASPARTFTLASARRDSAMRNIATWMRRKDGKYFAPFFARYPDVELWNAARRKVHLEKMDGLLLTGGPDVAPEFLHQPVPDPSVLDKDIDADR